MNDKQKTTERNAAAGNAEVFIRHMTKQIMRQEGCLMIEAATKAKKLYSKGIKTI